MFVFYICCVGSGLCDELISHSEETYCVSVCVCVCVSNYVWSRNLLVIPRMYTVHCTLTEVFLTLTEVFPCFFSSIVRQKPG